jgi:excisionase family DNA binding protein
METSDPANSIKIKWFSVKDAAEYLDVGEPTLYRWMKDGKITYRKVGETTRFLQEDLDGMVEVFHSAREVEKTREACPVCRSPELVEGLVQSTGLNYFRPAKAKFWTLTDSYIETKARMCGRCGAIIWYGDIGKLAKLASLPVSATGTAAEVKPPENPKSV